jgi:signal transduction histidine kinase
MTEWTKRDRKISPQAWNLSLVITWIVVTTALATWWMIHGLGQVRTLADLDPRLAERFEAQHRMILWEGMTFIALLLLGGAGLFWLLLREARRNEQMKAFFATFTHELKTPLASLRLQAEALEEDLVEKGGGVRNPLLDRLLRDTSRLELQLDNALFLATARLSDQIHLEAISLASVVERLRTAFPDFEIALEKDVRVRADRRALESIVKNLAQNARVHGKATRLVIASSAEAPKVRLRFEDNGEGFRGDAASLGKLFYRHTSQSGSGIGLHLCRVLVERMYGELRVVPKGERGFGIEISLPEAGTK